MMTLEKSLALQSAGEGAWRAHADPGNEANTGMFGGWTAALLLKSVIEDPRAEGAPSTLNVNYVSRIPPGAGLELQARRLGGSRSVATWQAEVRLAGAQEAAAVATVVLASTRESDGFTEFAPPSLADPDAFVMSRPPSKFGERVDMRMGEIPFNQPTSRSLHWVREETGHPMSHVLLAYLADCYPPRIFYKSAGPRPSSTLTMSVYFYASSEELAEADAGHVLNEVTGVRAQAGAVGAQLRIWSRAGALLATSEQMCWFR